MAPPSEHVRVVICVLKLAERRYRATYVYAEEHSSPMVVVTTDPIGVKPSEYPNDIGGMTVVICRIGEA
jgi:hypothetical protein